MRALAVHGEQVELSRQRGRPPRFTTPQLEAGRWPAEDALLRTVALVETFASGRLRTGQSAYMSIPGHTLTVWEGILGRADRSWLKRHEVWKREFNVHLWDCPDYASFRGFVEVRNAVTHGLGQLTDQQIGRLAEVDTLFEAARVARGGRWVLFGDQHVEAASHVSVAVVKWLDAAAPF